METTVTELPESRARVEVTVEAGAVDSYVQQAAEALGRELRLPGFRKGKVPAPLVLQRLGRPAVLEEALKRALPEWYDEAVVRSGIAAIGDPDLKMEDFPEEGEALSFSFEIGVRPQAELGDYKELEVGRREPEVPDEAVTAELDRLREAFARLEPVERPAQSGDFVIVDFLGRDPEGEAIEGLEGRDQLLELGSGNFPAGFEEGLVGAGEGDDRSLTVDFPDDYPNEELAGKSVVFDASVKAVNEKHLPDLDDEFASEASEFETLDELKEQIRSRLAEALEQQVETEFRQAAVDAAVENATVEVPEDLTRARAGETLHRFEHQLAHRGIDPKAYFELSGKTRDELVTDAMPEAEQSLKREAVLAAIADAEGIEISEQELLESLEPAAAEQKAKPEKLLERLRGSGREGVVIADMRLRRAVEAVAESAKPIPLAQAEAREKIWTPDDGDEGEASSKEPGGLWTPGS